MTGSWSEYAAAPSSALPAKTGTTSAPVATDTAASGETRTCMEFLQGDRSGQTTVMDNLFAFMLPRRVALW